jgi:prophage regulatory protein
MEKRMLRASDVMARTRLGRTTIWRLERAGDFPRRRQITAGSVGWLSDEIDAWLDARPAVVSSEDDNGAE